MYIRCWGIKELLNVCTYCCYSYDSKDQYCDLYVHHFFKFVSRLLCCIVPCFVEHANTHTHSALSLPPLPPPPPPPHTHTVHGAGDFSPACAWSLHPSPALLPRGLPWYSASHGGRVWCHSTASWQHLSNSHAHK